MAGDWIKIEKATALKTEIWQAAEILNIPPDQILGLCVRFWCWCDDHLKDGTTSVSQSVIDGILGRPGFCEAMKSVGWIRDKSGKLEVPNFNRHMANSAKSRASDAERAKKYRERKSLQSTGVAPSVTQASHARHVTERDAVTDASRGEEKRREEKKEEKTKSVPREKFIPPSKEEVDSYCREMKYVVDGESFVAYYETRGWILDGRKMKSWKSATVTWHKNAGLFAQAGIGKTNGNSNGQKTKPKVQAIPD